MRVKAWVELAEEKEIEIGIDDISSAIYDAAEPSASLSLLLNTVAQVLKAASDEQIAKLSSHARETVTHFLNEQAARYAGGAR